MASRDFQALSVLRRERAQILAGRYPASRQALEFCASLASFQERIFARTEERAALPLLLSPVLEWIGKSGTQRMREAALELDKAAFRQALDDYWERRDTSSLPSFFARAVLQPYAWAADLSTSRQSRLRSPEAGTRNQQPEICPRCDHRPQAGVLRPQGHGRALSLLCSLCLHEWPFGRGRCPACGEE
ncbi:MAG: formate dehydrogenase accessory protein FdhE, partial [Acidobacteriota bacterium]